MIYSFYFENQEEAVKAGFKPEGLAHIYNPKIGSYTGDTYSKDGKLYSRYAAVNKIDNRVNPLVMIECRKKIWKR